jgi:hypothetical protein
LAPSPTLSCGAPCRCARWGWALAWALGSNLPRDDLDFYGPENQTEFRGGRRPRAGLPPSADPDRTVLEDACDHSCH